MPHLEPRPPNIPPRLRGAAFFSSSTRTFWALFMSSEGTQCNSASSMAAFNFGMSFSVSAPTKRSAAACFFCRATRLFSSSAFFRASASRCFASSAFFFSSASLFFAILVSTSIAWPIVASGTPNSLAFLIAACSCSTSFSVAALSIASTALSCATRFLASASSASSTQSSASAIAASRPSIAAEPFGAVVSTAASLARACVLASTPAGLPSPPPSCVSRHACSDPAAGPLGEAACASSFATLAEGLVSDISACSGMGLGRCPLSRTMAPISQASPADAAIAANVVSFSLENSSPLRSSLTSPAPRCGSYSAGAFGPSPS
mmetsp:Transcript_61412/g.155120  ORF Transcript_61412/g.155120 Transcript_61412/m.155120 type:complete len:320 (-) Transcript_61412:111-1070(-)